VSQRRQRLLAFAGLLGLTGAAVHDLAALDPVPAAGSFALSESDLRQLREGRIVVRMPDSPDRSEVVSFAAVRVRTSLARVREAMRDGEGRRGDEDVLELGGFGPNPSPSDLAALTLEAQDLKSLRRCRVGECDMRVSAEVMERFQQEVAWSGRDSGAMALSLWQAVLASYAHAYLQAGDAGLPLYHDNRDVTRVADSLALLRPRFELLARDCPDLYRYVADFPGSRPEGAEDVLYWMKERFWRKTVTSLNHVSLLDRSDGQRPVLFVLSKQLYASHYFDSRLTLTIFAADAAAPFLIQISRARADIRPSGFTWVERLLLNRMLRGRLEHRLAGLRTRLEGGTQTPAVADTREETPRR